MDNTTDYLAHFACTLAYDDLPREVVHQVKRTLIDTLGCAVGGFDGEPSLIARRMAARVTGPSLARVLGARAYTVPDQAAFTNTVLVRYLDCNDTYAARGTGHPSDMIPAVLAAAGPAGSSGRDVIAAIAVAYEVFCRFTDEVPLSGWDQGMFAAVGAACGAGKVLGLEQAAMGNAISLALTWGIPLGVVRTGELSMWKGCATAAGNRTAVYAAQLATEGMTGPGLPFEGRDALWQHLGVQAPAWCPFGGQGSTLRILDTSFKAFPAVVHTQGPIGLVLQLREQVPASEVESVRVATYGEAIRRTAAEEEKWDPQTRETADHSIPYLVSAAWHDGEVTPATFNAARIRDMALRPFIKRLTAVEDPEFTRRYPAEACSRVDVTTSDGRTLSAETSHPKGHRLNPLSDAQVETKFRGLAGAALGTARCDAVLKQVWSLDGAASLEPLYDSLVIEGGARFSP